MIDILSNELSLEYAYHYVYDRDNHLIEILAEPEYRYIRSYEYEKKDGFDVKRTIHHVLDDNVPFIEDERVETRYYKNDLLIREETSSYEADYIYDENKHLIKKQYQDGSYKEYIYKDNKLVEHYLYDVDDGNNTFVLAKGQYDEKERLIEEKTFSRLENNHDKVRYTKTNTYNELGLKVESENSKDFEIVRYFYDKDNRLTFKQVSNMRYFGETEYRYDFKGRLYEETTLDFDGSLTLIQYEYDEENDSLLTCKRSYRGRMIVTKDEQ